MGGSFPHPYPIAMADVLRCSRVTQLLERLNHVVEESNLFDPERPSLGSELEALHQRLEALSSGPGTWESRSARPAGVPCIGMTWGVGRVSTDVTGSLPHHSGSWSASGPGTLCLHHIAPYLCA